MKQEQEGPWGWDAQGRVPGGQPTGDLGAGRGAAKAEDEPLRTGDAAKQGTHVLWLLHPLKT